MSKKFREAASFLTLLGVMVSFKVNTEEIEALQKKDKRTTLGSENLKSKQDKDNKTKYDKEEGHLDIDWKFDFDNMKSSQVIKSKGYNYVINEDSEAIILGYDKKLDKKKINIPNTLGKHPVTMIYEEAFSGLENTSTIELPIGIKVIGSDAFSYSEKLKNINIPDTVETIDSYAFDGCYELNNVVIPKNVINLGEGIFFDCISLTNITILNEIDELRYGFFAGCISLNNPNLPNSLKTISKQAFSGCTSLLNITIPDGVTSINDGAFRFCNNLKKITIPLSVENIYENIFEDCSDDFVIYLEKGSYAEKYANKYKIKKEYIQNKFAHDSNNIKQEQLRNTCIGISTVILNVRDGISTKNKQIGYLEKGMPVEIITKYANGWYKIKYNDSYGYVLGAYIKIDNNQEKVILKGKTKDVLNVRNGVLTSNKKIGQLKKESNVDIVMKYSNGWYKIKYNDFYGYVSGAYIELEEDVNSIGIVNTNLNVRDGASKSNEIIGYVINGERVEIVNKLKNGWYKIKYGDAYGYVFGDFIEIKQNEYTKIVATGKAMSNLNVRSGNSVNKLKIGELKKETSIDIIKELKNGWYKIKFKGSYGYVSGAYIKLDVIDSEIIGQTTNILKVREGASINDRQIGYLEKGQLVEVEKELLNGWYKIKYGSYYGYVSGAYIKLNKDEEIKSIESTKVILNVRDGACINATKIGYLEKNTKVEVVNKLKNGWYKIKYKNAYGYVLGDYLKLYTDEEKVIENGITKQTLNVRTDASTDNLRIGYIEKGQKVEIVNKLSNGWYKIKYKNTYGYISSLYVDLL